MGGWVQPGRADFTAQGQEHGELNLGNNVHIFFGFINLALPTRVFLTTPWGVPAQKIWVG